MGTIKKIFIAAFAILCALLFSRPVYGKTEEGRIFYYKEGEPVIERVLFLTDQNHEEKVLTLLGALIYNKSESTLEGVRIEQIFIDRGEIFIRLSLDEERFIGYERGIFFKEIIKTTCSVKGINSIMVYVNKSYVLKVGSNGEDL